MFFSGEKNIFINIQTFASDEDFDYNMSELHYKVTFEGSEVSE